MTLVGPNVWLRNWFQPLWSIPGRFEGTPSLPAGFAAALAGKWLHHAMLVLDLKPFQVRSASHAVPLLLQ